MFEIEFGRMRTQNGCQWREWLHSGAIRSALAILHFTACLCFELVFQLCTLIDTAPRTSAQSIFYFWLIVQI